MQLFYCARCGKRIKDSEVAPDTQPDAAICPDCVKQVKTASIPSAKAVSGSALVAAPEASVAALKPGRKERGTSQTAIPTARRSEHQAPAHASAQPKSGSGMTICLALLGAGLFAVGVVGLARSGKEDPAKKTAAVKTAEVPAVRKTEPAKTEAISKTGVERKPFTPAPAEPAKTEEPTKTVDPAKTEYPVKTPETAQPPKPELTPAKPPEPVPPEPSPAKVGEWITLFDGKTNSGTHGTKNGKYAVEDGTIAHVDGESADVVFPLPKGKNWDVTCNVYIGKDGSLSFSTPGGAAIMIGGKNGFPVSNWTEVSMEIRQTSIKGVFGGKTALIEFRALDKAFVDPPRLRIWFKKGSMPEKFRNLRVRVVE